MVAPVALKAKRPSPQATTSAQATPAPSATTPSTESAVDPRPRRHNQVHDLGGGGAPVGSMGKLFSKLILRVDTLEGQDVERGEDALRTTFPPRSQEIEPKNDATEKGLSKMIFANAWKPASSPGSSPPGPGAKEVLEQDVEKGDPGARVGATVKSPVCMLLRSLPAQLLLAAAKLLSPFLLGGESLLLASWQFWTAFGVALACMVAIVLCTRRRRPSCGLVGCVVLLWAALYACQQFMGGCFRVAFPTEDILAAYLESLAALACLGLLVAFGAGRSLAACGRACDGLFVGLFLAQAAVAAALLPAAEGGVVLVGLAWAGAAVSAAQIAWAMQLVKKECALAYRVATGMRGEEVDRMEQEREEEADEMGVLNLMFTDNLFLYVLLLQ